jgi:hypothetical protein
MKFNLILISLTEEIIPGAVNAKLRTGKHSIALLIRLKMYVGWTAFGVLFLVVFANTKTAWFTHG